MRRIVYSFFDWLFGNENRLFGTGITQYVPPRPVKPFAPRACKMCGGIQGHWIDCPKTEVIKALNALKKDDFLIFSDKRVTKKTIQDFILDHDSFFITPHSDGVTIYVERV